MKKWVCTQLAGLLLLVGAESAAQSFVENALHFSRTKPGGSARIQALGGAQIALGGDFSSALSNPAGLGLYNRSEFTFSPGINSYQANAEHLGSNEEENKSLINIPALSYVFHSPQDQQGFLGGSFAISMTRINDFNFNTRYTGNDNLSSIVDFFLEDANGTFPANINYDFPTGLAYDNYLLEDSTFFGGPQNYYFSVMGVFDDPDDIRRLKRTGSTKSKGAQYQWSLAYGGNYSDKLFFGVSIGITTLRYTFNTIYRESNFSFDLDPDFRPLDYLELEETIDIEGSGVNLSLGVIYRPVDRVQVGVSLVTPTFYNLTDTYTAGVRTKWNNYDYLGTGEVLNFVDAYTREPILSEYKFTTPLKISLGTAIFIGSNGFISGDVELINYKKARYESQVGGVSFNPENDDIKAFYTSTVNYRLGGEYRYELLRFRAGYNVQSNPYNSSFDVDRAIKTASTGFGIRTKKFFADVAWLRSTGNRTYSPYVFRDGTGPIVDIDDTVNSFILTLGFSIR